MIQKLFIALISIIVVSSITACDRLNMYDLASGKSRTAYALIFNGTTYRLAIAHPEYDKIYTSNFVFSAGSEGVSANNLTIIVYDSTNTYISNNDLTSWLVYAAYPASTNVIGYHDNFICRESTSSLSILHDSMAGWVSVPLGLSSIQGIFNGYDGEVYVFDTGSNYSFYRFNGTGVELMQSFQSTPPTSGTYLGGFRTKNYFYVWYNGGNDSIFRTNGSVDINYNDTTAWSNVVDVAITDDDKMYAIIFVSGTYNLLHIKGPMDFTTVLFLGTTGTFKIDCLDSKHIIVAAYGNTDGYNGLFIYNVESKKIEKFITAEDAIALYVHR